MLNVQLFAKRQEDEQWVKLDLFAEEAIKLTLSVQDIIDPTAATSIFSRTFRIPNTSINAPYFESVFNVNSTDFDASQKAEAYINDNGIFFTNGNIRLNAIYTNDKSGDIQYEITFYGETSDFGSKIGGGFLNQVDISDYNHSKSWGNIQSSWTNGLFNGDIVYGLIEWGYNYDANNQPTQPTLSNGFVKSFTSVSNPLQLAQWKPQIRAKALWDRIFRDAGYTYDSDFLNSDLFKQMYVISDNEARTGLGTSNLMHAQGDPFICLSGVAKPFNATVEISDPGNNYNPTTSEYTTPSSGIYTFEISYYFDVLQPANNTAIGYIQMKDELGNVIDSVGITNTGMGYNVSPISSYINAGVKVHFEIQYVNTGFGNPKVAIDTPTIICSTAPSIMSVGTILPANIRKIDFMKSVINRFRLVFVPSRDQQNHFTITPWKDWILQGDTKDWTRKLNTAKDLKIQPLFYDQSRLQVYKDQEDGDYLNYNYQLTYKQTVGQYNLDSNNELITGVKTYQDQFAPTPIAPIGYKTGDVNGSRFLVPHIAKDTGSSDDTQGTQVITGKREPIQPKLRLVFYNGLITAPLTWYAATNDAGTNYTALTSYPLMSQYSAWPTTPTTFDLNWENEAPFWDTTDTTLPSGQTTYSCFNVYWKTWYDVTFDPYSRLVEASFLLDYNDILDLKFNDYVFVKDAWYFVNKIQDYVVGQLTECKVQLVKLGNNIGVTIPYVTPTSYPSIYLCKADTACNAFCCKPPLSASLFYMNNASLATSTQLYLDPQGSGFAPAGIYSDGTTTVQVNAIGQITAVLDTSGCNCTQTAYSYTTKFANVACDSCCDGVTTIVYSASSSYNASVALYLNAALTIPAPAGFYRLETETGYTFQVGQNGLIQNATVCTNCICETYYEHPAVCVGGTLCEACCCTLGSQTVWTNSATWNLSTEIYQNNAGTPIGTGYYKKGNDVAVVATTPGQIDSFAVCTSCSCGEIGDVDVTVEIFQELPGFTSSATLQSSIDNINWTDVTTLSVDPSDPANTTASQTVQVLEGRYLRCIFTSNVPEADLNSIYLIGADNFNLRQVGTPGSDIQYLPSPVVSGNTYGFMGSVIGGNDTTLTTIYVSGAYNTYKGAGWPAEAGGGTIGSILAINDVTDIYTPFNVQTGFSGGYANHTLSQLGGILATDTGVYVGTSRQSTSYDITYKGVINNEKVIKLDLSGNIDPTFDFQGSLPVTTTIRIIKNYGSRLYTLASSGVLIVTDLNGAIDPTFTLPSNWGNFSGTTGIFEHNNLIYLVGRYYNTVLIPGTNLSTPVLVLNYDGSVNMTETDKFVYAVATNPVYSTGLCEIYNNKIYIPSSITSYKGTTVGRFMIIDLATGNLDSTFDHSVGFNVATLAVDVTPTAIYVIAQNTLNTTYNGVAINPVVKLNYDGSLDTNFNIGPILRNGTRTTPTKLQIINSGLYVGGDFSTINGTEMRGLVRVSPSTGVIDSTFPINTGFNGTGGTAGSVARVTDFWIKAGVETVTYPLTVDFNDDACTAFCTTPNETVYGNADTLYSSTILYYNTLGTIPADPGYYSDGVNVAQVGTNGVIVSYYNTSTCNCGGQTLYEFTTNYSASTECDACCSGIATSVWGTHPVYSDNAILYADALGNSFAPTGWYTRYIGVGLQVGLNGVVIATGDCVQNCSCGESCSEYRVRNTGQIQNQYSYYDCFGNFYYGTLEPGEQILTACADISQISVTGSYQITLLAVC